MRPSSATLRALPNKDPGRIARASKQWHDGRPAEQGPEPCIIDFVGA